MAIVSNPIIGNSKGNVSSLYFSRSKKKNIIKSIPLSHKDTNSASQSIYRTRFLFYNSLYNDSKLGLSRSLSKNPLNLSANQAFFKLNSSLYNFTYQKIMFEQTKQMKLSSGSFVFTKKPIIGMLAGLQIRFVWYANEQPLGYDLTDVFCAFVYDYDHKALYFLDENVLFSSNAYNFSTNIAAGSLVSCYAVKRSQDGLAWSTSRYCGSSYVHV